METQPKSKGRMIWGLRILGSAVILGIIFTIVPFGEVWEIGRRLPPALWLLALGLFLAGHAVAAYKWSLVIGVHVPFGRLYRAHLAGLGANLALPGVAGGDLVRAGLVFKETHDRGRLVAGSLADRLVDTLALVLIALAGAWALWSGALATMDVLWRLALLVLPVAAMFFVMAPLARHWMPLSVDGRPKPLRLLLGFANKCSAVAQEPGRLAICLVMSLFVQCLFVAINVMLARATAVMVADSGWYYAWAAAKLFAILPISLGGLGVREASMAVLLKPFGADAGQVVAIGLLWQTILYASGIIGLLVQMLGGFVQRGSIANKKQGLEGLGR
jgi:uncharacterized protein (TIRG00374 family)